MAVVTFNPATFKLRYPELAGIDSALLELYFNEATVYCCNTHSAIIRDVRIREIILNMLTAHIATLAKRELVGRISSATEGSVTVSAAMTTPSGSRAWFDQTPYGASAWQAMGPYRTAIYIAPPRPIRVVVPEG